MLDKFLISLLREEEAEEAVKIIRGFESLQSPINLSELFIRVACDVVSRSALGGKYDSGEGFGELARKAMGLMGEFNFGDFVPWLWWVDSLTGFDARVRETVDKFHQLLDRVIEEHEDEERGVDHGQRGSDDRDRDLVDVLLRLQKDEQVEIKLTRENIKAILLDMFIGGTDNNASILEWAMAELMKNPSSMKKTQEEIRKVVGNKQRLEEPDIEQMTFLKCVVKETFRLHAPVMIARESNETFAKINGYDVPPKTRVMMNSWAIQRDPAAWARPEEFVPERFAGSSVDLLGRHGNLMPFGSGRRVCPGIGFAITEIECVLANLLCWFDWDLPEGECLEKMDMSDIFGLVIRKRVPLSLVPKIHSFST